MLNFLFPLHRPKGIRNPYKYYPEQYYQDSSLSVVTNGFYDMTKVSEHEDDVIRTVLQTTYRKYPTKYHAIGLANESQTITYKPRYVLFEIIVELYKDSDDPLDLAAVSFAYESKGAMFRREALHYYEKAKGRINLWELNDFASVSVPSYFLKMATLYEREHKYGEAIECLKVVLKCRETNIKLQREKIIELSNKEVKPVRRRETQQRQIDFEKGVHNAALYYIKTEGIYQ